MRKAVKNLEPGEVFVFNGAKAMAVGPRGAFPVVNGQISFVYLEGPVAGLIHVTLPDYQVELSHL